MPGFAQGSPSQGSCDAFHLETTADPRGVELLQRCRVQMSITETDSELAQRANIYHERRKTPVDPRRSKYSTILKHIPHPHTSIHETIHHRFSSDQRNNRHATGFHRVSGGENTVANEDNWWRGDIRCGPRVQEKLYAGKAHRRRGAAHVEFRWSVLRVSRSPSRCEHKESWCFERFHSRWARNFSVVRTRAT